MTFSINPQPPALIINDGSLPALVACWAEGLRQDGEVSGEEERRTNGPIAWFPSSFPPAEAAPLAKRRVLEQQYELCQLAGLSDRSPIRWTPAAGEQGASSAFGESLLAERGVGAPWQSAMLLAAGIEALMCGRARVVWPVCLGSMVKDSGGLAELADLCDRAMLIAQTLGIDVSRGSVTIETPFVDLTDEELVEMAMDLGAPLRSCWWCDREGAEPCGVCASCTRWTAAVRRHEPGWATGVVVRPWPGEGAAKPVDARQKTASG